KSNDESISNKNSSVSFSLKGRKKVKLPPPVYLCETSGKIVVNIKVDTNGLVTDAYINSSSSTKNQCLVDSALDYAKNARFSSDAAKTEQIGSITYYFKGKR
ncbi:MAG: TonB family protein, partial [Bacteroidota bacterium]